MENEALSDYLASALQNEDDGECQVKFFKLEVAVGPVSWAFYAFIHVLEAEHH